MCKNNKSKFLAGWIKGIILGTQLLSLRYIEVLDHTDGANIVIIIKVGPCLLGLGVMMVMLRLLFCRGLPCTRGLTSDNDDIIMVRPRHEAEEVVIRSEKEEEEATAAMRQLVEGKSYKARIIVNHHSYNKQAPL